MVGGRWGGREGERKGEKNGNTRHEDRFSARISRALNRGNWLETVHALLLFPLHFAIGLEKMQINKYINKAVFIYEGRCVSLGWKKF